MKFKIINTYPDLTEEENRKVKEEILRNLYYLFQSDLFN